MKKTNIFLGIVSTILISGFIFGGSNNINPNLNNNTRYMSDEVHVSTFEELSNALKNENNNVIIFDNDIDLSNFTPDDVLFSTITGHKFTIDGNGYSFVNKPSKYYSTSIFDNLYIGTDSLYITFRNLTLDNVGSFINQIQIIATEDYDALFPDPSQANLIGKGLTFQNITIKNNMKQNETYYLTPRNYTSGNVKHMYQFMSLLINNVFINHAGDAENDEALTFSNIVIENNHIDNNNFYIQNNSYLSIKPMISESFLANLEFLTCHTSTHHHHSFITYEYIYIKNNSFTNNTFKIGHYNNNDFIFDNFDSSIYESFGNLSGNANGLSSQIGTNGNYLMMHDIYISNNQISESKKINADGSLVIDKYEYSELIANANSDKETQYLSTIVFKDIFIFNNESYYLNKDEQYVLTSQEDLTLLNITLLDKNNNPNTWNNLNSTNFFVYGPMYDASKQLRIFKDISGTSINNINYGRYLFEGDDSYYELLNFLADMFGIYGYQIDFEQVEDNGQIKNAVSSISKVNEEHIDIFYDNLIYKEENNLIIVEVELSFKYYQVFNKDEIVDVPYQISNLKLYNDKNKDQDLEQDEIIATSEKTYNIKNGIYHVNLKLKNQVELTQELIDNYDLNNMYLGFDYSNDSNQKVSSSTTLKIDPDQLKSYFPGFPNLIYDPPMNLILIGSISAVILFIILLILLILLILWLLKRRRINNTYILQDGYYEYAEEPNYLDNQDYTQNLYSNDSNYLDYENQEYDYNDQNYNYDESDYDYNDQNYNYDESNYDFEDQSYEYDKSDYDYNDQNYNYDEFDYDFQIYYEKQNKSNYEIDKFENNNLSEIKEFN